MPVGFAENWDTVTSAEFCWSEHVKRLGMGNRFQFCSEKDKRCKTQGIASKRGPQVSPYKLVIKGGGFGQNTKASMSLGIVFIANL